MNLIFYHVAKILFSNFICIFKTLTSLEVYHITIIRGVVNKKLTIFEALRISRRVFHISYFIFFSKILWSSSTDTKRLFIDNQVTLETILKVPSLAMFDFLVLLELVGSVWRMRLA